ncbi:MAG TPA: hypothetical protein P5091_03120, partial [Acholeplasmataceae bacterium]|nr:hypothetical protein [Acholeplasmataceae bacterium]
MDKRLLGIMGSVFLLIIIFIFRIILNTYDSVWNHFAQWVLFIEAIGIMSSVFYLYKKQLITFFKARRDLLMLSGSLIVMELFFMLKNADQLRMTYPFGLIISIIMLVIIYSLLPVKLRMFAGIFLVVMFTAYTIGQDVYLRIFNDYFS